MEIQRWGEGIFVVACRGSRYICRHVNSIVGDKAVCWAWNIVCWTRYVNLQGKMVPLYLTEKPVHLHLEKCCVISTCWSDMMVSKIPGLIYISLVLGGVFRRALDVTLNVILWMIDPTRCSVYLSITGDDLILRTISLQRIGPCAREGQDRSWSTTIRTAVPTAYAQHWDIFRYADYYCDYLFICDLWVPPCVY